MHPPFPESKWTPPTTLPDRLGGVIGVDTETNDQGLASGGGSGWAWKDGGFVAGYSISADNFKGYLPIAHEGGGNMDPVKVRKWLNHVLADEKQPKVFAQAMYDIAWAERDGVKIGGPIIDVLIVEAMLDEYRFNYSLDAISQDRLGRTKDETLLKAAAEAAGYHEKEELWRLHSKYVGPYAEMDADLARDIWKVQEPLIIQEELGTVLELEHDLIPMYIDMRRRGVRIDLPYVEGFRKQLTTEIEEQLADLKRKVGFEVNVNAAKSVAAAFDTENLKYGRTATNLPSITSHLLETTNHWLPKAVLAIRQKSKLRGTFIDGQILGQLHAGYVHGEIHPMKSDDGGTVTGRLSMSNPNLQFIPTRTEEGARIRRAFLPYPKTQWASADFSQQEPRLLVHFASLVGVSGALRARERYLKDPDMSYHDFAAKLTGLDYKAAKILNLAIIYGRGIAQTANELGKSHDETKDMFATHHREMPFAKGLSYKCMEVVKKRGFIRSLLKRRMRFPYWEPESWDLRERVLLKEDEARAKWPNTRLQRARLHKSLNSLIQPSAADQTKLAMREVYREGYGKHVMIQVHDELCCSVPDKKTAITIGNIMRDAVKLEVPVKLEVSIGPNWRDAKK